MSKESFARAENSSDLGHSPLQIKDVDRLTALAGGNELGGLLFRVREAGQPQWSRRVVLILARRMVHRHRIGRRVAESAAACALEEFVYPHCRTCGGARELMGANLKVTCPACGGLGRQRYTDAYRKGRIGAYGAIIEAGVSQALQEMENALGAFLGRASGRLG